MSRSLPLTNNFLAEEKTGMKSIKIPVQYGTYLHTFYALVRLKENLFTVWSVFKKLWNFERVIWGLRHT